MHAKWSDHWSRTESVVTCSEHDSWLARSQPITPLSEYFLAHLYTQLEWRVFLLKCVCICWNWMCVLRLGVLCLSNYNNGRVQGLVSINLLHLLASPTVYTIHSQSTLYFHSIHSTVLHSTLTVHTLYPQSTLHTHSLHSSPTVYTLHSQSTF